MNYIGNKKYLKSNDVHFYIGWALIAIGSIFFLMGEFLWIYIVPYQFFVSIICLIFGAIVEFVPKAGCTSEEDIDRAVKDKTDKLCEKVTAIVGKSILKQGERPAVIGNYLLDRTDVIVRKGRKDQKIRSSVYSSAVIAFKKESIYIHQNTFSLISDEETETATDIPYANCPKAVIEEREAVLSEKAKTRIKVRELHITDNSNLQLKICVVNSMLIDEICEKLNAQVKNVNKK